MDYEPAGDMELIGITAEAFQSRNGYQEKRYIFWKRIQRNGIHIPAPVRCTMTAGEDGGGWKRQPLPGD